MEIIIRMISFRNLNYICELNPIQIDLYTLFVVNLQ